MNFKYLRIGRIARNNAVKVLEFVNKDKGYITLDTSTRSEQIIPTLEKYRVSKEDMQKLYRCKDNTAKTLTMFNNTLIKAHDFKAYPVYENMLDEVDILDDVLTDVTSKYTVPVIEEELNKNATITTKDIVGYVKHSTNKGNEYYTKVDNNKLSLKIRY